MKSEINPSNNYSMSVIEKISRLSIYSGKTLFEDMTREQILGFLDSLRKPEASDPLYKSIGSYNLFRLFFVRFFKLQSLLSIKMTCLLMYLYLRNEAFPVPEMKAVDLAELLRELLLSDFFCCY